MARFRREEDTNAAQSRLWSHLQIGGRAEGMQSNAGGDCPTVFGALSCNRVPALSCLVLYCAGHSVLHSIDDSEVAFPKIQPRTSCKFFLSFMCPFLLSGHFGSYDRRKFQISDPEKRKFKFRKFERILFRTRLHDLSFLSRMCHSGPPHFWGRRAGSWLCSEGKGWPGWEGWARQDVLPQNCKLEHPGAINRRLASISFPTTSIVLLLLCERESVCVYWDQLYSFHCQARLLSLI